MKNRTITKIISCVLCTAMSMQVGLALTDERVNAAEYLEGAFSFTDNTAVFSNEDDPRNVIRFSIYSDPENEGQYYVKGVTMDMDPDNDAVTLGYLEDGCNIVIGEGCSVIPCDDISFNNVYLSGGEDEHSTTELYLREPEVTLTINGNISGEGENSIINWASMVIGGTGTFDIPALKENGLKKYIFADAEIYAKNVIIDDSIDCTRGSIYVTDSFTQTAEKGLSYDFDLKVYAEPDTTIESAGGRFTLSVDEEEVTIFSPVSGNAEDLLDYSLVKCEGIYGGYYYHGELTFTPIEGYEIYCSHLPGDPDDPSDGYHDSIVLDEDLVNNSDVFFNVRSIENPEDIVEEIWLVDLLPGDLTLDNEKPSLNEILLGFNEDPFVEYVGEINDGDVFVAQSIGFDIRDNDKINTISVSVNGTDLEEYTKSGYGSDVLGVNLNSETNVVKHITVTAVDYAENEFSVSFTLIEAPVEFVATVSVEPIYVGGTPEPSFTDVPEDYPVKEEEYTIVYLDKDGNETNTFTKAGEYTIKVTFPETDVYAESTCTNTFNVLRETPVINITVPDDIYAGNDYLIEFETDSDADPKDIEKKFYKDDGEGGIVSDTVYLSEPAQAGNYIVIVNVPETDSYEAADESATFTVLAKEKVTATISVEPIYVGGTPETVVTDYPEIYDEDDFKYTVTYLDKNDVATEEFKDAGTYTVSVYFPETETFAETTLTEEFEVLAKEKVTATISVEPIYVGGTPETVVTDYPEIYDSDDYEFTITYLGKNGEAVTEFTEAGTYTVSVFFPETDVDAETTITKEFKVLAKEDVTATVSVDPIYVGGTPETVVTDYPEIFDEDDFKYTVTYLDKNGDETEEFTEAGTYSVSVFFPETEKYKATTITKELKVNKIKVTATISVADTLVGKGITVVLTTDPEDYKGSVTYEYKLKTADDTAYTTTAPTAAGEYTVRATLAETDEYLGTECTDNFAISKNTLTATVSVPNIKVGGEVKPTVTTDPEGYNGEITYKYKLSDADDSAYSKTGPTAAGTYTVEATLASTKEFLGTTCTGEFTISKNEIDQGSIAVTVENIKVGQTPEPLVTGLPEDYDGEITFVYFDGNGNSFSTEPLPAGNYLVRATIPETDKYERAVCETDLEVRKNDLTEVKVTVESIKVGQIPEPLITGLPEDYDGEITIVYIDGNGNSCPAESLAANNYLVRATIPATDKYERAVCETDLEVDKNELTATVSVADIMVGGEVVPVLSIDADDYNGEVEYYYKSSTATTYSETVPTDAGTYTVLARLLETDKYWGTECTSEFTISKNTLSATVSVADIKVGGTPNPSVTTDPSDYNGKITYEYKLSTAEDSAYSTKIPTAAGTYTVRATLGSTPEYLGTECTAEFTISRNVVTATVTVADITVKETPDPSVKTVPSDYNGKPTFVYKNEDGEAVTVFDIAGTYTVTATLPETDVYEGTECSGTFTVSKKNASATVKVADITVGKLPDPVVTTNSNGKPTFRYKVRNAPDSAYTSDIPINAGSYTVEATIEETDAYLGTTCTAEFTISKNKVNASISVDDIAVGGTVKPVLSIDAEDYNGKIEYAYKLSTADDSAFSVKVPSAPGKYTVKATLSETGKYLGTVCTSEFTISKGTVTATVSVADITAGDKPKPVVKTTPSDYDGEITYEYKPSSADDSAYSTKIPSVAGKFTVRATLSSTVNYLGTTCTAEFTVSRKEATATVSVADITVGNTPKPVVKTESNGNVTYEYKSASAPDSAYTTAVPTEAGRYTVRVTVAESDKYLSTTCTAEFTISLNPVKVMELSVPDIYYGQTVKTSFKTDSNGEVTIKFKPANAADSAYSATAPTQVGKYTAMASVSETKVYEAKEITVDFSISYLDAPQTAFIPSGTSGKNGYYTSDVVLNAPSGFLISASASGPFTASIPYTEGMTTIYLKRASDNALTAGISISNMVKIDKAAPSISSSENPSSGSVVYASSVTVSVSDKNLVSLTVNGSPVAISADGSASVTLTRPESGFMTYRIVAEDEAGNISTMEITLMAEWLADRKIPEGTPVSLVEGEVYYLEEGQWIVSMVNSDGTITEGTTVYSGNIPFYVNTSGDYIFTRVT